MKKIHRLKTWEEFMPDIISGVKSFEVRIDDRGFQEGDTLILEGWDNEKKLYTGNIVTASVTYILYGGHFGIEEGYVVMAIKVL